MTVSATYGTGGSVIAPRLAEELGLPFVDRLISVDSPDLSQDGRPGERDSSERGRLALRGGLTEEEQATTPAGRFLSYFARAASVGAMMAPDAVLDDDDTIRAADRGGRPRTSAAGAPAVVLGRAGAVVLASRPRAFHVRLDGPVERRVAWAASHENVGPRSRPGAARARRTGPAPSSSSVCSGSTRPSPACTTWCWTRPCSGVDARVRGARGGRPGFLRGQSRRVTRPGRPAAVARRSGAAGCWASSSGGARRGPPAAAGSTG